MTGEQHCHCWDSAQIRATEELEHSHCGDERVAMKHLLMHKHLDPPPQS